MFSSLSQLRSPQVSQQTGHWPQGTRDRTSEIKARLFGQGWGSLREHTTTARATLRPGPEDAREHLIGEEPVGDVAEAKALANRMFAEANRIWRGAGWKTEVSKKDLLVESKHITGPLADSGMLVIRSENVIEGQAGIMFKLLTTPEGYAIIDPFCDPIDHERPLLEKYPTRPGTRLEVARATFNIPFINHHEFVLLNAINYEAQMTASKPILHDNCRGGSIYSAAGAPENGFNRALTTFALKIEPISVAESRVKCVYHADMADDTPKRAMNWHSAKRFLPAFYTRLSNKMRQLNTDVTQWQDHFNSHQNIFANAMLEYVSNEDFSDAANLALPHPPNFTPGKFIRGKGQAYSSWETSRHQNPHGRDMAVFKLSKPRKIGALAISTEFHDGNHAPATQLWGCSLQEGKVPPMADEEFWNNQEWTEISPKITLKGHAKHYYQPDANAQLYTHMRIDNIPDGGISRISATEKSPGFAMQAFSVDDQLAPIPALPHDAYDKTDSVMASLQTTTQANTQANTQSPKHSKDPNLISELTGARVIATSNQRYSTLPERILSEQPPLNMGDGLETARQRLKNDTMHWEYAIIQAGVTGQPKKLACDFTYFVYNTPVFVQLLGWTQAASTGTNDHNGKDSVTPGHWTPLVETTRVKDYAADVFTTTINTADTYDLYAYGFFPCGGTHRIKIMGNYSPGEEANQGEVPQNFTAAQRFTEKSLARQQRDGYAQAQLQKMLSRNIEVDIASISRTKNGQINWTNINQVTSVESPSESNAHDGRYSFF